MYMSHNDTFLILDLLLSLLSCICLSSVLFFYSIKIIISFSFFTHSISTLLLKDHIPRKMNIACEWIIGSIDFEMFSYSLMIMGLNRSLNLFRPPPNVLIWMAHSMIQRWSNWGFFLVQSSWLLATRLFLGDLCKIYFIIFNTSSHIFM